MTASFISTFISRTATIATSSAVEYFAPLLMFFSLRVSPDTSRPYKTRTRIDSLLGEGMTYRGDITGDDKGIRIDGPIVGNIHCPRGVVVISNTGSVEGSVFADFVVINGTIKGSILATGAAEIQPQAKIYGNVNASFVELHYGAAIFGKIETTIDPDSKELETLKEKVREVANTSEGIKLVRVK